MSNICLFYTRFGNFLLVILKLILQLFSRYDIISKEVIMSEFDKKNIEIEDDFCDLEPNKICDNCCKCIEENKNYKIIKITKIINDESGDDTL